MYNGRIERGAVCGSGEWGGEGGSEGGREEGGRKGRGGDYGVSEEGFLVLLLSQITTSVYHW